MNIKVVAGFVLAFLIGVGCRFAGVPLPAPPVLIGALLVVAMTVGYMLVDRYVAKHEATQKDNCGGPSGMPASSAQVSGYQSEPTSSRSPEQE